MSEVDRSGRFEVHTPDELRDVVGRVSLTYRPSIQIVGPLARDIGKTMLEVRGFYDTMNVDNVTGSVAHVVGLLTGPFAFLTSIAKSAYDIYKLKGISHTVFALPFAKECGQLCGKGYRITRNEGFEVELRST